MKRFLLICLLALPADAEQYGVQVGAFKEFERAENAQEALEDAGFNSYFSEASGYKRVRLGPFNSRDAAQAAADDLWPFLVARFGPLEFQRSWVVVEDRQVENAVVRDAPLEVHDPDIVQRVPDLVRDALGFQGVPYRWGGTSDAGFDCSGFVQYIFLLAGQSIPRQAKDQFLTGDSVEVDALEPGDLVFFTTYSRGASHVGIYIGGGEFVHSSSGEGHVTVTPLSKRYYANRYLGARRIR